MKTFKMALLVATTALLLQGCGDDSDSDSDIIITPPVGNAEIIGTWGNDDTDDDLLAVAFLNDGTYVHVQVDEDKSLSNPENGMEWGEYTIDKATGLLTSTQLFDNNGMSGLSETLTRYVQVSNNKLIVQVDRNSNGVIDSDESFSFSKLKSEGYLGYWKNSTTNNKLLALVFTDEGNDDGSYVQLQVDNAPMMSNPENGMEWGSYSIDDTTKKLTVSQLFDENGEAGLSDNIIRYLKVSGDTLTLEFDENQNGVIDSGESLDFQRQ